MSDTSQKPFWNIYPSDKSVMEILKDVAAIAIAGLSVIYATGWVIRSLSLSYLGVGQLDISHQSAVGTGLMFYFFLVPAVYRTVRVKTEKYLEVVVIFSVSFIAMTFTYLQRIDSAFNLPSVANRTYLHLFYAFMDGLMVNILWFALGSWGGEIIKQIKRLHNQRNGIAQEKEEPLKWYNIPISTLAQGFWITSIVLVTYISVFAKILLYVSPSEGGFSFEKVTLGTDYGTVQGVLVDSDTEAFVVGYQLDKSGNIQYVRVPRKIVRFLGPTEPFTGPVAEQIKLKAQHDLALALQQDKDDKSKAVLPQNLTSFQKKGVSTLPKSRDESQNVKRVGP